MRIAIIGGGFSGTSVAAQLILNATSPLSIYLCEGGKHLGQGTAYSTPFPWHLLNVPAAQMGLLADEPEGFYTWLEKNEDTWRNADPEFKKITLSKNAFLPRQLYGLYLTDFLNTIKKTEGIDLEIIRDKVVDIDQTPEHDLQIIFRDKKLKVDQVILATGVQSIKKLPFGITSKQFIENLWDYDKEKLVQQISNATSETVIFIIGTGLTMIDMVTTLNKLNYPGKIIALSRHGKLPLCHHKEPQPPLVADEELFKQKRLLSKYKLFRKQLTECVDWRQLFDAIRPRNSELWQQLSVADKKRFLRHLLPIWNNHRHRMPLESGEIIDRLLKQKQLKIIAGTILEITEEKQLEVRCENGAVIKADFVFNCTGPEYVLAKQPEKLIQNLIHRGWITPDDLGLGIKSNTHFQAEGPLSERLYVIGSLLFGDRFETTATPDLRHQAKAIACAIARVPD